MVRQVMRLVSRVGEKYVPPNESVGKLFPTKGSGAKETSKSQSLS
jgi:hypothetical protein